MGVNPLSSRHSGRFSKHCCSRISKKKEMGNKEAKFKKMYEEIDISGNGEVSFNELAAFIISDKVVEELKEFSAEDISAIEKEFNEMDEADVDGKLTFEEFMEAMKKNKTISKLILKIADSDG